MRIVYLSNRYNACESTNRILYAGGDWEKAKAALQDWADECEVDETSPDETDLSIDEYREGSYTRTLVFKITGSKLVQSSIYVDSYK